MYRTSLLSIAAINGLLTASIILLPTSTLATNALNEVIVTAARTPQAIDHVIASVTVITREKIEQSQVQSLPELLRQEVGLDMTSQGGLGKLSAMFIRGTEPEHILVLIDGVRFGSVTAGTNPFEYVPVDQIERIEIVRGPRSSLYGSDAIGGVIQIFTRSGNKHAAVTVGGGSQDTARASADFSTSWGDSWMSVSGSEHTSAGFNSCKGSPSGGCFTTEPDDDGFRNSSGSARIGHRWGEAADIEIAALYSSGHTEFDGSFANETNFREFVPSFRAHAKPLNNWRLTFISGISYDDQDNFINGNFTSNYDTERRSASIQSDVTLHKNQIISVGVDYLKDKVSSTTLFNVVTRDNQGIFGQYQVGIGDHHLSASARYDDNEQFGGHTTGNAGWKWQLSRHLAVLAAWGTAFRAPSFNDLYYPNYSNANLNPERSRSAEIGISGTLQQWQWSLNAYQTDIDELIELNTSFLPANLAQAKIRGIEAVSSVTLGAWDLSANYSWTDPRNRVIGANYDNVLLRRARHSGLIQVAHNWGAARLSATTRAQGRRFNNPANTTSLGGYVTTDLSAEYTFAAEWKITAKISNLFDREYETVYLYNEAPRTVFISLKFTPSRLNK